jgi:predicted ribosomally synthesized peptide with nif11-like leader
MPESTLKAFIEKVEKEPELQERLRTGNTDLFAVASSAGFEVTKSDAKGFLSEMERITQEDKTEMPPLVVIIMAYLNMIFPE